MLTATGRPVDPDGGTAGADPLWTVVVVAAYLATMAVAVAGLLYRVATDAIVPRWQASQYWLGYAGGFVRRGLPGEVLARLVGGVPSYAQMALFGVAVSVAALVAIGALITVLRRDSLGPAAASTVVAVLVVSPLTLSLVVRDVGRYDGIGVVVLVGMACWARSTAPRNRCPGVCLLSVALAVATASEEFLVAYLLPAAVLAVWARFGSTVGHTGGRAGARAGGQRGLALLATLVVMLPALGVLVASVLVEPSRSVVADAVRRAQEAGVRITDRPGTNALVALLHGPGDAVAYATRVPLTVALLWVGAGAGFFFGTAWLVWTRSGRPRSRCFWSCATGYGLLAVGMGMIGVDYRRWWFLAMIGLLGCLAILGRRDPVPGRGASRVWPTRLSLLGIALFMTLSVVGQLAPVFPSWTSTVGSAGLR